MSRSLSRPRLLTGSLGTLAASALVATSLATAGPALADTTGGAVLDDGAYVVTLVEPPAATYDGGVAGLEATQPDAGTQLDAEAAPVDEYRDYLEGQQEQVADAVDAEPVYTYTTALNGFSAELTGEQASALAGLPGVLSVQPDEARQLDTVASPEFLGLTGEGGVWSELGGPEAAGSGTVVGVIDSGVWPENPSFAGDPVEGGDTGEVGVPYRGDSGEIAVLKADGDVFEGACEEGEDFTADLCNSKLVSARYFSDGFVGSVAPGDRSEFEYISPRDGDGHGSHTASTAAGNDGVPMSADGRDFGVGSGVAPAAGLAVYKVCWEDTNPATGGCYTSDSIAAIDQAVLDGVDVLNYSISGSLTSVVDPVELAFLSAASAGVFVAASAGNSGPGASTVAHNSPWLTTVAASTHAVYEGTVELGDGSRYRGASISDTGLLAQTPTVLSSAIPAAGAAPTAVALCGPGSLDAAGAAGTIVVCDRGVYDRVAKSAEVARAGGVGMILANTTPGSLDADFHAVPTVHVDEVAGAAIKAYVSGTAAPTSALLPGDQTGLPPTATPVVAGFSSRGPAAASGGDVLKPDISAPGVSVLAAVAPGPNQGRDFNFLSGTSMSSPHVAGIAALMFQEYPQWSPMQVKSAMMTTAYDLVNADGSADTNVFNQGAGHVDPTRSFNPGLVYDSGPDEWLSFIEGTGTETGIPGVEPVDPSNLNYPSIAIGQLAGSQTVTRSVTAVTPGLYRAQVDMPGFNVRVVPSVLNFSSAGQTKDFRVIFQRTTAPTEQFAQGHLTWGGGGTTVRSPIAVKPVAVAAPAEVTGAGASGSLDYQVTPGTSGPIDLSVYGLAAGDVTADTVAVGALNPAGDAANKQVQVTIPAGTTLARFDLVAGDQGDDLDLVLLNATRTAIVAQSATGAASEQITLLSPPAGTYWVHVNGYATTDGAPAEYSLRNFVVGSEDLGNATVSPDPLQSAQGRPATVTVAWDGLEAGVPHLGWIGYEGSPTPTIVAIEADEAAAAPEAATEPGEVTPDEKLRSAVPVLPGT